MNFRVKKPIQPSAWLCISDFMVLGVTLERCALTGWVPCYGEAPRELIMASPIFAHAREWWWVKETEHILLFSWPLFCFIYHLSWFLLRKWTWKHLVSWLQTSPLPQKKPFTSKKSPDQTFSPRIKAHFQHIIITDGSWVGYHGTSPASMLEMSLQERR